MSKILVVVDYQKDFVDGTLGFEKATLLEDGIYNKVKENLKENNKIIFTYDTHGEDYLSTREGVNLPVIHCIEGSEGHKLYGKVNQFANVNGVDNIYHINKQSFGARIEDLKLDNITEIEICGIVTNMCVISNAVVFQTKYPNANIIIDASCCASFNDELHDKSLDVMEGLQMKVINR
ncbi:MAG: isochorismatase family cysteine hydrolase [Clostridium sp.]